MIDLDWPYHRHLGVFAGTQRYAELHDWECTIDEFAGHTLANDRGAVPYDGVIARATTRLANACRRRGIPIVNTWANSPARYSVPSVLADADAAGRFAAEHLLARGLRNFAALVSRGSRSSQTSCDGFAQAVRHITPVCHFGKVPTTPTKSLSNWQSTERALKQWMDKWSLPIGVFVGSDSPSRLVVQMSRRRGWRIPEDVAIIAGSDEPIICEHPHPSITSVNMGYERIGFEAAQQLDAMMTRHAQRSRRKAEPPVETLIPPQGLVVRQSTDFYCVDDEQVTAALRHIADNCHRPLSVDQVADAIGIGRRTLQNRFRQTLDRSIAAEIRRVRIERVKRELANSERTLAEIAADVGFRNPQRLCEAFQRDVGMSPGQYRNERW